MSFGERRLLGLFRTVTDLTVLAGAVRSSWLRNDQNVL